MSPALTLTFLRGCQLI